MKLQVVALLAVLTACAEGRLDQAHAARQHHKRQTTTPTNSVAATGTPAASGTPVTGASASATTSGFDHSCALNCGSD